MNAGILRRIREQVRKGRVFISRHAEDELEPDGLTAFDLEILLGTGFLAERQRDRELGGWKYVLEGAAWTAASRLPSSVWIPRTCWSS